MAPKFPIGASVCIARGPAYMARGLGRISHYDPDQDLYLVSLERRPELCAWLRGDVLEAGPPNYRIAECCYSCAEGHWGGNTDPRWRCRQHGMQTPKHDVCDDYRPEVI